MADVRIQGLRELGETLKQLPLTVKETVARGAVRTGMKDIRYAVESEIMSIPLYDTGLLSKSVRVAKRIKGVPETMVAYVLMIAGTQSSSGKRSHNKWRRSKKRQRGGPAAPGMSRDLLPYYWYMLEFGWHRGGKFYRHPFMVPAFNKSSLKALYSARDFAKARTEREIRKIARMRG